MRTMQEVINGLFLYGRRYNVKIFVRCRKVLFVFHAGTGVRSVSKFHNAERLSLKF